MKWNCLVLIFSFLLACSADAVPVELRKNGVLKVENLTFSLGFYNPKWVFGSHNVSIKMQSESQREGIFRVPGGEFRFTETLTKVSARQWNLKIRLDSARAVETNQLFLGTDSPHLLTSGISVDGKLFAFPENWNGKMLHPFPERAHQVEIPMMEGRLKIAGTFGIWYQDNRQWHSEKASVRFLFTPSKGKIRTAELNLTLEWLEYSGTPLKMKEANSLLKDDISGDQKGGWTDQGDNDMHQLPAGMQRFCGIPFEVTGRCLGFYHPHTPFYPKEITVSGEGKKAGYLYLLHAEGWEPLRRKNLGTIRFRYEDGSVKEVLLNSQEDCGNFWQPKNRKNALVAWRGNNGNAGIGIYVSKIRTENKTIRDITFTSAGNSVWLIAAMSLSDDSIPMYHAVPLVMKADSEWHPIRAVVEAEPGSVLDFSEMLDAPAGKYGFVRNIGGRLGFENAPEKQIRFYGTNICYEGNFISRPLARKLARILRERGYNLLRFHHFGRDLIRNNPAVSTEIDPVKMDRMDGIFAEAKAQGIYMSLDLFISRPLRKGEVKEFPDQTVGAKDFKQLIIASPSALENWKKFAANFLTHVNPYTGLAWKDDPALISINLINEGNIAFDFNGDSPANRLFRKRYPEWLKTNGFRDSEGKDIRLWRRFIVESYRKTYAEMKAFLRGLGVRAMVCDQNCLSSVPLTVMRNDYDLVDNHFYHSHPAFPEIPWRLPFAFSSDDTVQSLAAPIGDMFASRIFGKPFTITEWDYCNPASFAMEGALVTSAYGALNDWDALCHFQMIGGGRNGGMNESPVGLFSCYSDPVRNLADRIGALLFLRRDVRTSGSCRTILVPPDYLEQNPQAVFYPPFTKRLGLIERTGTVLWDGGPLPEGTGSVYLLPGVRYRNLPEEVPFMTLSADLGRDEAEAVKRKLLPPEIQNGIYRSLTGEIELNHREHRFSVVTPGSEAFSLQAQGRGTGRFLTVQNRMVPGLFFASSITAEPLQKSTRILLLHLTQVRNTGMRFRDDTCSLLEEYGRLPLLLRRAEAVVTLNASSGKLYACSNGGKRLYEVPLKRLPDGKLSFLADNTSGKEPILVYEFLRTK